MSDNQVIEKIRDKYEKLWPYLNEKTRRIWAGIEARSLGWGGITQVSFGNGAISYDNSKGDTFVRRIKRKENGKRE